MVSEEAVREVLRTINDPEMPISIVDLGIVEAVHVEPSGVRIDLLPTFVGCPALPAIEEEVRRRVGQLPSVERVEVRFLFDPAWTVDRINPAGREALRQMGVTVPGEELPPNAPAPVCPFCGSSRVRLENAFGPTRCRMIYYCEACRNPFEHLKRVGGRLPLVTLNLRGRHGD
jgi:ring-1,2-phenylacetyl-CoA epoxidase subunit PaaD